MRTIVLPDGRALAYAEYGDPGGRPVIYFHGWPSSRLEAVALDDEANRQVVRIVAVDRPGFGGSDVQRGRRLQDWPADVAVLADALGFDTFGLLGWSGGGPYVLACAWAIPERIEVAAVVSGQAPPDGPGVAAAMRRQNRLLARLGRHAPALTHLPLRRVVRALERDPDGLFEAMAGDMPEVDRVLLARPETRVRMAVTAREALRRGTRGAVQENTLLSRPWGFPLGGITREIHLWHGELDGNVPVVAVRRIAAELPHCRATFFPDEGHVSVMYRHRDTIVRTLCGAP